jgi:D-alanyl-D-alanine endopeptidase (penicillin-binding protein 7)
MMKQRLTIYGILIGVLTMVYIVVNGTGAEEQPKIVYDYPSLEEVSYDLDICKTRRMSLNAKTALIIDNNTGAWIYKKYPQRRRPIASLTKLLTAMVYLDMGPNLDTVVYISNRDCYQSAKSNLRRGEAYKARDLLYATLMASDNRAARAIATASGLAREIFIKRMNEKARWLGMMNTEVVEVTGLDERNISTAADIAILIREAMTYPMISKITSTYRHRANIQNRKRKKNLVNTNRMVVSKWKVMAGKTGFILKSDYCLATVMKDKQGREITVVVLGSPTNSIRFQVARKLAYYGFKHAERKKDGTEQIAGR